MFKKLTAHHRIGDKGITFISFRKGYESEEQKQSIEEVQFMLICLSFAVAYAIITIIF